MNSVCFVFEFVWCCLFFDSNAVFVACVSLRVDYCLMCVLKCSGFVVGSCLLVGALCLVVGC